MASFLTLNLGGSLTITASLPAFLTSLILELLTGRVVLVPFDESVAMEGIVFPTTTSFPDDAIRSILAAGFEKKKLKIRTANRQT